MVVIKRRNQFPLEHLYQLFADAAKAVPPAAQILK
jgi:hypothetical protein